MLLNNVQRLCYRYVKCEKRYVNIPILLPIIIFYFCNIFEVMIGAVTKSFNKIIFWQKHTDDEQRVTIL